MNTLSYKTISANVATVDKKWLVIDAEGFVLGRLTSQVANILRGKNKPSFTPHVDCGDNVIIINAEKIKLTGKKWDDKEYEWYTGYPGGQRHLTAKAMKARDPRKMLEIAVRGMLPRTKLGRQMFRNLYVYAGPDHPHAGQNPEIFEPRYK